MGIDECDDALRSEYLMESLKVSMGFQKIDDHGKMEKLAFLQVRA